jgi:hypothetical protein
LRAASCSDLNRRAKKDVVFGPRTDRKSILSHLPFMYVFLVSSPRCRSGQRYFGAAGHICGIAW